MSLSDNYKPVKYLGNGITQNFTFGYNMTQSAYCRVFLENKTTHKITPKVIDIDYSLNFDDNGGTVTMITAPTADEYIVIYRSTTQDQTSAFLVGESFPAARIEDAFDKNMAAVQELQDAINRSPQLPEGVDVNLTLPQPQPNKAIVWNEKGDGFVNSSMDFDLVEEETKKYRDEAQEFAIAAENSEIRSEAGAVRAEAAAQSAVNTVNGFDQHAADKQNDFDANVKVAEEHFSAMGLQAINNFNVAVEEGNNAFYSNVMTKLDDFDAHAMTKEMEFDDNAAIKQGEVDASVEEARKWAVGTIEERPEGSAEYWAKKAGSSSQSDWNETNSAEPAYIKNKPEVVTLNTDQEVDSSKTFLKDQAIKTNALDIRTDTNARGNGLIFTDKNGTQSAGIGPYVNNNGAVECRFVASNGTKSAFGGLGVTKNGQGFFEVPTPKEDSNNRDAINSEWITPKLNNKANTSLDNLSQAGKDVIKANSGGGVAIGSIFPAPYNGFIPEGAVPCDGTEYDASQFQDFFDNWLGHEQLGRQAPEIDGDPVGGRVLTCTYSEFDYDVTKSGGCIKFAVSGNKFRVPKIGNGTYLMGGNGESVEAGLPNITGNLSAADDGTYSGAFAKVGDIQAQGATGGQTNDNVSFDASRSSIIYGKSSTVQTKALGIKYYVQLTNGSINQSSMDWSQWATSLESKANTDLSNVLSNIDFINGENFSASTKVLKTRNNFQIQYGRKESNVTKITLARPFKGFYYVFTSLDDNNWALTIRSQGKTATNFDIRGKNNAGQYFDAFICNWIAIGIGE